MASRRCYGNAFSPFRKIKRVALLGVFILAIVKFTGYEFNTPSQQDISSASRAAGRHLLSTVEWEQCDYEIGHKRNYSEPSSWYAPTKSYGWVTLYCILVLIIFVALAIICDDFFVPSLEAISEKLDLSEDVAGATFMAAGSSAPELFTSIAGVTVESDVGVGTIVGSAVFNLLGICALSAAFAGQVLHLDWRPLTRDATFYGFSICVFIVFAWDGKFYIYESCLLLCLYIIYIILMKFNPRLMELMSKCCRKKKVVPKTNSKCMTTLPEKDVETETKIKKNYAVEENGDNEEEGETKRKFSHVNTGYFTKEMMHGAEDGHTQSRHSTVLNNNAKKEHSITTVPETNFSTPDDIVEEEDEDPSIVICPCLAPVNADIPAKQRGGCTGWLRYILGWILFVISFPFVCLFTWTIPNCSTPKTKKYYLCSFIMSIIWIAVLSFGMVTVVGRAGCILGIDKFTMGLVIVAIGTSIPDALSSILVARDGYGDMAVSNAIGSNVFDINLGLGLPFLISSLIRNFEPVSILSKEQRVQFDNGEITIIPHVKFGFILLLILALSLIVFSASRFRLNKCLGVFFVCFYVCFVVYAYVQDLYCNSDC